MEKLYQCTTIRKTCASVPCNGQHLARASPTKTCTRTRPGTTLETAPTRALTGSTLSIKRVVLSIFQHSPSCRFDNKHSRVRSTLSGPCPWTSARRWTTWCGLESVGVACGGGRFCKRTGMLFSHCGTPSCRYLQCRFAHRVCTFAGLPHQHGENSRQNNQPSLSANIPHYIAVFVSDCLRHSVVNITMSRLSSLVSSCLDAGSTTTQM